MNLMEKWNNIVDIHNKLSGQPEPIVQQRWAEMLSEIFGYSKLFGDIDQHRKVQIGSTTKDCDIIITNTITKEDKFLIELKITGYNLNNTNPTNAEDQMFSYISSKNVNANIGIVICNKIHIYAITSLFPNNYKKMEIEFSKDNELGAKFIELFYKNSFDKNRIFDFVEESSKLKNQLVELRKLINDKGLIKDIIKQYFVDNGFDSYNTDKVLDEFDISISSKLFVPVVATPAINSKPINLVVNQAKNPIGNLAGAKLGGAQAKAMFARKGIFISGKCNYASKNTGAHTYWANPNINNLNYDWYLILDDYISKKLYLFRIPANTFRAIPADQKVFGTHNKLIIKSDNQGSQKLNVQIEYDDMTFREQLSGNYFKQFLIEDLSY